MWHAFHRLRKLGRFRFQHALNICAARRRHADARALGDPDGYVPYIVEFHHQWTVGRPATPKQHGFGGPPAVTIKIYCADSRMYFPYDENCAHERRTIPAIPLPNSVAVAKTRASSDKIDCLPSHRRGTGSIPAAPPSFTEVFSGLMEAHHCKVHRHVTRVTTTILGDTAMAITGKRARKWRAQVRRRGTLKAENSSKVRCKVGEIDLTLFDRSGRRPALTPEGVLATGTCAISYGFRSQPQIG
jgi:hypothetical protein